MRGKIITLFSVIGCMMLLVCGCSATSEEELCYQIQQEDGTSIALKAWKDEKEKLHVFLPSFCEETEVSVKSGKEPSDVSYHRSANVATLFIETESKSMDAIHSDKEYREAAVAMLFTENGELDYSTTECSLKGRGNTTWDLFEKKPYQLKLEEAASLLGMGEGKKWILLANAFDETHLRNKVIYDLAGENDFCFAPECEYVDLYLNGEYRGLYLLAERVEFGDERLNMDAEEKYMCNVEPAPRWETLENAFLTDKGRAMEIREPDEPEEQDFARIKEIADEMETVIMGSEKNVALSEMLDIDSWAYKYMIDEIMENGDADIASSYFYYADGKVYAGPLWDYDNTLGVSTRNQNPNTFLAKSGYVGGEHETPYYDALNQKPEFYERMTELYREKMRPALEELIHTGLSEKEEVIANAVAMNRIRWGTVLDAQNSEITDAQGLADYLEQRIAFLDSAWIDGEEYYTIQFEPYVIDMYATSTTDAGSYAVKQGESAADILPESLLAPENGVWVNSKTGEIFDPEQILTENVTLRLQ